jgi:hypothetical protein
VVKFARIRRPTDHVLHGRLIRVESERSDMLYVHTISNHDQRQGTIGRHYVSNVNEIREDWPKSGGNNG